MMTIVHNETHAQFKRACWNILVNCLRFVCGRKKKGKHSGEHSEERLKNDEERSDGLLCFCDEE